MSFLRNYRYLLLLFIAVIAFFTPALLQGKMLLPADTIVGLYHPYRDLYASTNPNGLPYKNALITDPVRQQYPWKSLSMTEELAGKLPTWNPYTFSGTPLLANMQSAAFYPLNIVFFVLPFMTAWNVFIILQVVLGSLFMYHYLKNLRLATIASLLGSFVFVYSGFFVAWLEWGNILHTAIWLPLILLSIDKMAESQESTAKRERNVRYIIVWSTICTFALVCSFFAGHLQTFFYLFLISVSYFLARWWQHGKKMPMLLLYVLYATLFAVITAIQWHPTMQFLFESARDIDQMDWEKAGWFIPWQHSIQFIVPDFFGNPTTLNYFGTWNYAEFIGYIGIIPFVLSLLAVLQRRDKKTWFFLGLVIMSILFAFPTFFAKLPFQLSIPLLSTAQPTRLIFVIDFALAVLTALGLDYFLRYKKGLLLPAGIVVGVVFILWAITFLWPNALEIPSESISVVKRNLQLPTLLVLAGLGIGTLYTFFKHEKVRVALLGMLVLLTVFDLYRFHGKFTPFSPPEFVYPVTKSTTYLQKHIGFHRFVSLDSRILPPNFSIMYELQTVEGYDPLYLRRYGELLIASERGKPDTSLPFGFNRILTPHSVTTPIMQLLGVKYVLSLTDLSDPAFIKVFQEGETRIYEKTDVLPRAFFVQSVISVGDDKEKALAFLFSGQDLRTHAVVEDMLPTDTYSSGSAEITSYTPSRVTVDTQSNEDGFLLLTDAYYPTWQAFVTSPDGKVTELPIYRTNYHFRGVIVPKGNHTVEFTNTLF